MDFRVYQKMQVSCNAHGVGVHITVYRAHAIHVIFFTDQGINNFLFEGLENFERFF